MQIHTPPRHKRIELKHPSKVFLAAFLFQKIAHRGLVQDKGTMICVDDNTHMSPVK